MIQKNFAEDRRRHGGLLIWSLDRDGPPQYLHIANDHEYLVLKVDAGQITGEFTETQGSFHLRDIKPFQVKSLPNFTSLRYKCDQLTTHAHLDTLTQNLVQQTETKILTQSRIWLDNQCRLKSDQDATQTTVETTRPDRFNLYLAKYYPDNQEALQQLHLEYHSQLEDDSQIKTTYGKWNLISLEMENIYNYTGEHTLTFNQLPNDIISITGKNGSGKSKIIDTLLVALYGCGPKFVTHTVSHGQKRGLTKLTLSLNGDTYRISRHFLCGKRTVYNKTEVKIEKNGIDQTATDKPETERAIIRLFGERDDLCDTHISLQGQHQSFIHKTQKSQLELLKRVFNTNLYETIQKTVKTDLTQMRKDLKRTQQQLAEYPKVNLEQLREQLLIHKERTPQLIHQRDQLRQRQRDNDLACQQQKSLHRAKRPLQNRFTKLNQRLTQSTYSDQEITLLVEQKEQLITELLDRKEKHGGKIDQHREAKHPLQDNLLQQLQQAEDRVAICQSQLDWVNQQLTILTEQIGETTRVINNLNHQLDDLKIQLDNLPTVRQKDWKYATRVEYGDRITQLEETVTPLTDDEIRLLDKTDALIQQTLPQIANHQWVKVVGQYNQYNAYRQQLNQTKQSTKHIQQQIKEVGKLLSTHLFTYNDECSDCLHNKTINLIPKRLEHLDSLNSELLTLKEETERLQQLLQRLSNVSELHHHFTNYNQNLNIKQGLVKRQREAQDLQQLQDQLIEFIADQKLTQQHGQLEKTQTNLNQHITKYQHRLQLLETEKAKQEELRQQYTLQHQRQTDGLQNHRQAKLHLGDNQKLDTRIIQLTQQVQQLTTQIQKLEGEITDLKQMRETNQKNNQLEEEIKLVQQQLTEIQTELDDLDLVAPETLETQLVKMERQLDQHRETIHQTETQLEQGQTRLEKRDLLINTEMTQNYDLALYQDYLKITQDYPLYLNQQGLKTLEKLINQSLWNMTKFRIQILDQTTSIHFLRVDDQKQIPIEYCSGFECFAISLAIRIALAKIHPFNSMNSLIIDEGFGVFDSQNLKRLPEMLEPLRSVFRQIFIITHIDELQSELRHKITITTDHKGQPRINY